jgi:hypothetical protein
MRTECIEERVLLDSVEKIRHVARFKKSFVKKSEKGECQRFFKNNWKYRGVVPLYPNMGQYHLRANQT